MENKIINLKLDDSRAIKFLDINKNSLSKEEQNTVEVCYSYILYNVFNGDKKAL